MNGSYVEHRPRGAERWIECVWERSGGARGALARVIPDGCMDLVWSHESGLLVVGANTSAFLAELAPDSSALGVRMHPGCAPPLLGVSAEELRDGRAPGGPLWDGVGARLEHELEVAPDSATRRALLIGALQARGRAAPSPDPLVRGLVGRLVARPGERLRPLARDLGVSERQLRRRVISQVGYGPKRLGRVLRLRRALADVQAGADLAEAAFGAGYADQAHFTNDCGELAGATPAALRRG
jgi:AraC-like DNA-binding protein